MVLQKGATSDDVTEFAGEPVNLDFEQIVWAARERLESYDFLEGDLRFLARFGSTYSGT